jgi:hypothetical protein
MRNRNGVEIFLLDKNKSINPFNQFISFIAKPNNKYEKNVFMKKKN